MKQRRTKKQRIERAVILVALVAVLGIFAFFLRDILIPVLKLEFHKDMEGAQELLRERGFLGCLSVVLVEALQMVVVFIPAEFIQISAGLSYPFPLALLLCDLGVCLGASIIFLLVRLFRFREDSYAGKSKIGTVTSFAKHEYGTVLLLYFLFFMPVIPFGAICYYGSSTKIRYPRYLLTVATGVIPSIVVSNLMGGAAKAFFREALPIWLLVLIIIFLAALLFSLILFFLNKFYFKENSGTPDSIISIAFFKFVHLLRRNKQSLTLDKLPEDLSSPYILLSNHQSFYDFYYLHRLTAPTRAAFVANRYYLTRPIIRRLYKKAGFIPKKLFNPDPSTSMGILRTIKRGYPVIVFPEGRLSTDGRTNPIVEPGGALYRKLGVDLVLVNIEGAYFANPKWRRHFFPSDISVKVRRVIKKDELDAMTDEELDAIIEQTLNVNAADTPVRYMQPGRAQGLENILYRCADCGALYTTEPRVNRLVCRACGSERLVNHAYRFQREPFTIPDYYHRMEEMEEAELDSLSLKATVKTRVFDANGKTIRRETGECRLTKDGFFYTSASESFEIPLARLPAIPYSPAAEFEVYRGENLYYFYPVENPRQVVRWALCADLLHRRESEKA